MTNKKLIMFRGRQVSADWPKSIKDAQLVTSYRIKGLDVPRHKYEDAGQPCPDCAVIEGEFHVPGCYVERCPVCGRQSISCDCPLRLP